MAAKDKFQKNAEQEDTGGTGGTKEPSQSTAEFYSIENAPTLEDFTSGSEERDHRQEHEDEQAAARDGGDSGYQGSSETKVPESSDVGGSLLGNPADPQAGRLGDRLDDLGLRPDHTSPNVFDDAAAGGGGGGSGGYGQMGNEGLMGGQEKTGGAGYPAGTYDDQEGLRGTNYKPGDTALENFGKDLSSRFVPGEGLGERDKQIRDLNRGEGTVKEIKNEDGTTTKVTTYEDGTKSVEKGNTTTTLAPNGTVTEKTTDPKTGETKTETYKPDDSGGLFGIPDDENEGGDLPPGFIDGEALLPPEMRTESILQNMTGAGQKGGEEVKPAPEGGTGQSGGTVSDDAFRQTTEEMIGQPDPEATHHGGKSPGSAPTFGPGQEEIDPGEDGSLPPGETRSEDLPGGTTSSQDDSLGLEGGHDGEFDFSGAAGEIQDAQNPPQLPPGYEDDTTDELDLTTTTDWAEQIQDALNPPVLPPEPLDPTDDAGF